VITGLIDLMIDINRKAQHHFVQWSTIMPLFSFVLMLTDGWFT